MKSIYVCHTFYHVLISAVKEMNKDPQKRGEATVLLSTMSCDFGSLKKRLVESALFKNVIEFDEKRDDFFPELAKYKKDKGNVVCNMISRIKYTRRFAKLEERFIPVDFKSYDEINVFCDADPIGIYLSQNRIYYHAIEDGMDTLSTFIHAKYENRGHFGLKKFLSLRLNLIFIRDGYNKYCIDMEVNDRSKVDDDFGKYVEVSRKKLMDSLSDTDRKTLVSLFVSDIDGLNDFINKGVSDGILILTEPLCNLDIRKQIFTDIIDQFKNEGVIFLKPHPRDDLDYRSLFSEYWIFDKTIPMEILGLFKEIHFKKVVGVYTQLGLIDFADERIMLGSKLMDKYEAPEKHFAGWRKD